MDKLIAIKIKMSDDPLIYSDPIPIGADAANITYSDDNLVLADVIENIETDLSNITTALFSDVGKVPKVKTVQNGKVVEWEFDEINNGSGNIQNIDWTDIDSRPSINPGMGTNANHRAQHVFGQYNISDSSPATSDERGNYIEIIGNGSSSLRSNARTLDWDGNEVLAGKLTVGTSPVNNMDVATKKYVDDAVAENTDPVVISETISQSVTDWLNDHIDSSSDVVIDDSLTVTGAAADSKKVGDELTQLKADLTLSNSVLFGDVDDTFPLSFENGTYYATTTGSTLTKYYGGGYDKTRKVVKSTVFNAPCNVSVKAKTGYSFTVFTSNDGIITRTSGLVTEYTMISGNQYGMTLRATGGTDDISAVDVSSIIDVEYDSIIEELSKDLTDTITEEQVPETLELVANEYVGGDGAFKPSSNWSRTGYIEVTPGQTITIVAPASSQYNVSYDTNKAMVGSKWSVYSGENTRALGATVKYIVLSGTTANMQRTTLYLGSKRINLKSTLPLTETMSEDVNERIAKAIQPIQIDRIISPTAYLMKQQIPTYYFSRSDTPLDKHDIGYLDDKINSIPDGYHFIFVTDTHWNDNAKQSPKLISYVKDRIGAPYVLFGGDILTAYRTEAEAYRWMCDFMSDFKNAFGNNFLPVVGNHDLNKTNNTDPSLMYSDLVPLFTQGCDSRFHYCDFYDNRIDGLAVSKGMTDAEVAALKQYFRTCYYVDDNEGKVRFIVYNTGAGDGGSGIRQYIDNYITGSYEEMLVMEWVYNVLMNTPEGYNVILSTHIPGDFSWSTGGGTILSSTRKKFAAMVSGLKLKKRVTVPMPASISDYSWWGSDTFYFDYTDAPDVGTVAVIGGHTHVDTFGKYGFYNQNYNANAMYSVQGDVNGTSYTCYQSSTEFEEGVKWISEVPIILTQHDAYTKNSGPNSHAMELDTTTEQCFDVVTIRPNGDIALTRFGAGNDRYLTII